MFRINWVHLGLFGCVTTLSVKRVKLVKKFVPWSPIGIFCNERTQSTPLDPKLMFYSVFYYLGAFGTVWLPYKTRCKTGQTGEKLRAMKSHQNFSQQMQPIHPHLTLNSCFCAFHTIWVHLGLFGCLYQTRCKTGRISAKVSATKSRRNFSHEMHPIHPIGP